MMRVFTDIDEARKTLLARVPASEEELPERFRVGIRRIFGRDLSATGVAEAVCLAVQREGDTAVRYFSQEMDGVTLDTFEVSSASLTDALQRVPGALRTALEAAADRVRRFHEREHHDSWWTHDGGDILGQVIVPLERVGVYVPGGTAAYPSSLLMSVIPAKVAGVREIIVATPPHAKGVPDVILAACAIAGADRVFTIGGAQAIAALAYGTESIPKVDMIVGPGNPFVAAAKRYVFGQVAIDQIAGPTETLVIADETANPAWVAADLIAQAEHGETSSAILLALTATVAAAVDAEVERQLADLPRADIVQASMAAHGGAVIVPDVETAVMLANAYAPEHLCLCVRDAWQYVGLVRNAGGVFVGEYSPEVLGDYIAGPSHIMPTGGTARFSSAMHVGDFLRTMSVIGLTPRTAATLAAAAATVAHAEGLDGHARAARIRNDSLRNQDAKERPTTKSDLLETIRRERAKWEQLISAVTERRMTEPGAMGIWTFKDLLSHLTAWQQFELGSLSRARFGVQPDLPCFSGRDTHHDQDAINHCIYAMTHDQPVGVVLADARQTWQQLEDAVSTFPEDALTGLRFYDWMEGKAIGLTVVYNATAHYHEDHEADVRAWLARYDTRTLSDPV